MSEFQKLSQTAREWLFDAALPFWSNHGVDGCLGGFRDLVPIDGADSNAPKRTFVQARQMFSFIEAGRLGWPGPWRELAVLGAEVLDQRCPSEQGGYVHRLRADLEVDEPRRDLYDQAFVAFASANAAVALSDERHAMRARTALGYLDRHWRRGSTGYWEGELPPQPPRRQNPHMHLVEASWAMAGTAGAGPSDLERMNRHASAIDTFADRANHVLPELFDEHWLPLGRHENWIEPGHHFEWFWLLERVRAAGGIDRVELGHALWEFGLAHGIDGHRNVAMDELTLDGGIRSAVARLWPQTERLKAAIAGYRLFRSHVAEREISAAFSGLQPYLAAPLTGGFFDKMRPDGSFVDEPMRASSLYHIICAYSELIRLAEEA